MRRQRRDRRLLCMISVSFGAGLLFGMVFSLKMAVVVSALLLVILGLSFQRKC